MQAELARERDVDGESDQSAEDSKDREATHGDQEAEQGYASYAEAASDLGRLADVLWVTATRELIYLSFIILLCECIKLLHLCVLFLKVTLSAQNLVQLSFQAQQ